jgi:hypothetical protein
LCCPASTAATKQLSACPLHVCCSLEAQCKRWALAGAEASAAAREHAAITDRCAELEQQRSVLSETLSHERAVASAAAAAAASAAASLHAEITELRVQVRAAAGHSCVHVCDSCQVARAPSVQDVANLKLQLQLHAAGAHLLHHARPSSQRVPLCDSVAADSNRLGDDLLSSLHSDLSASTAIRSAITRPLLLMPGPSPHTRALRQAAGSDAHGEEQGA